ncbi:hypothetical protein ACMD2_15647 [Ananas comosus]|uniref:Transmembrane protein n=1 Tax=Ananas comosus TaxID=4615 RepID=A0A199UVI5_ANACO|nr:hypothetical protein ACMD2_15647 [Ananas comosus]
MASIERFKLGFRSLGREATSDSSNLNSSDQAHILVPRAPERVISLWTCSKMCALTFAVGVVVGFTLKRRLRQWAVKLLKRLKDD